MSWRNATPTSGFGITVDYSESRAKAPKTIAEARDLIEKGRDYERQWGHAVGLAFHEAALSVLAAIEKSIPDALVEIVTSGHVDGVHGGYGSVAVNIHRKG